jgi:hypothetical protein
LAPDARLGQIVNQESDYACGGVQVDDCDTPAIREGEVFADEVLEPFEVASGEHRSTQHVGVDAVGACG